MTRLALRFVWCLLPVRDHWAPWTVRRVLTFGLLLPAFAALQLMHWTGFFLDDLLFRAYRKVPITEPLFVVGLPRSGTSYLQRVLARDDRLTTMRLWELVLAPSITERKLWLGLAALDRAIGRPFGSSISRAQKRVGWMDAVHPLALDAPEEDYLLLLPIFACFLLVLPFPLHPEVWKLTRFDDWTARERAAVVAFYRSCVQRHLYVAGPDKRLLSKNPSFTPFARTLAGVFPDARFLCCVRDPRQAVPSQLSSLADGMAMFGTDVTRPEARERFVGLMEAYAKHATAVSEELPEERWSFVPLPSLRADVAETVARAYRRFGWPVSRSFREALEEETDAARSYRSKHSYDLEDLGLSRKDIERRFEAFITRFGFEAGHRDTVRNELS